MSDTKESAAVAASYEDQTDAPLQTLTLLDVTPKLDRFWIFYPRLLQLNLFLLGGLLSQVVNGYDGSMMTGLQALPSWANYFNNPTGAALGTMVNGISVGSLVAIPLAPHVIGYLGRRYTIVLGCIIIIIGAVLQGAAQNFGMFIVGRILLGFGNCLSGSASPPLVTECAYPTQRPVVTALLMPSWPFGAVIAALVTWGPYNSHLKSSTWAWRIPSLLQCALPLIQMIIAFFGPESPRWLIDKGRDEEAAKFFAKYHALGDVNHPIVQFQMAEIQASIEEEKSRKIGTWLTWFSSRQMMHRLFIVFIVPLFQQLSGNSLITYYLTIILNSVGITDPITQLRVNLGLNGWTLTSSIMGAYIVGKFKRRTLFLTGYAAMTFVYTLWTIMSAINQEKDFKNKGISSAVVFFIFLYNWTYQICSPIAFTYTMEVCPYSMRAMGATIYQLAGNLIGFFNNYVNPIALVKITWKYYIVYCVWLVVQFTTVYFLFPETAGKDLEDVAEAFGDIAGGREAMQKQNRVLKLETEHIEV